MWLEQGQGGGTREGTQLDTRFWEEQTHARAGTAQGAVTHGGPTPGQGHPEGLRPPEEPTSEQSNKRGAAERNGT